jgi:DNA polymerase delta subunit 3
MLFDFYEKQNAKKPGSVHATYLVTGIPRKVPRTNGLSGLIGEDTDMRSSPFMSSLPEPGEPQDEESEYTSEPDDENTPAPKGVRETQIVLVQEEQLEGTCGLGLPICLG